MQAARQDRPDLDALIAVIARSQIVIAGLFKPAVAMEPRLPAGYTTLDIAVLDWLAAEGRRHRRSYRLM